MNTTKRQVRQTATAAGTSLLLSTLLATSPAWAESAASGDYKIDPAHTSVLFTVSHLGVSQLVGRFDTVEGAVTLNPKGKSSVEVVIATDSVDTNHKKRDDHLRSPDFFNARQFPEMKFVSSKLHFGAGGLEKIDGKLSLHGKTNPVTLTVNPVGAGKDPWGGYRAGYTATTSIKRSDYGMNFMPGGIGDDIEVSLNIEGIKQ